MFNGIKLFNAHVFVIASNLICFNKYCVFHNTKMAYYFLVLYIYDI